MKITFEILKAITPQGHNDILMPLADALNKWLPAYHMTDKRIVQCFLAQCDEETDGQKAQREYASGKAYEGRKDLGNTQPGDGVRYAGRGEFMITGRANYTLMGEELGLDLVGHPELLLIVDVAVRAACQYWNDHKLSPLALAGNFREITHRINGGYNGEADREIYWRRCQKWITEDIDASIFANPATQLEPQAQTPVPTHVDTPKPETPPKPPAIAPLPYSVGPLAALIFFLKILFTRKA